MKARIELVLCFLVDLTGQNRFGGESEKLVFLPDGLLESVDDEFNFDGDLLNWCSEHGGVG